MSLSPLMRFRRTNTPPSPLAHPPSPTLRMGKMANIPSIATTSTPPSSPTPNQINFVPVIPPLSPVLRRKMQLNLAVTKTAASTAASLISTNTLGVNVDASRVQPVASGCPVRTPAKKPPMKKVAKRKLGPGCGLLDWIRLCRSGQDLAQNGGTPKSVTLEELSLHDTEADAWTAIRGKVYNITPYMKFHPGGKEELMKGAGIDCTILFDEVHNWVNVENTLKACFVGPLVENSPNTQRRNSIKLVKNARKESTTLCVPKTVRITDGVNRPARTSTAHLIETTTRKTSMELRNETQAATANEEPDGSRQVSPDSPIRPMVGETTPKKTSTASLEAAEGSSIRLHLPPQRIRKISEPHPRFSWVQSEKAVSLHILTQSLALKNSDVVLDVNGRNLEAAIFINDWVFEVNIALAHKVVASQVAINCGRVEISLKKEVAHQQWEEIGTYLKGHAQLSQKNRRGIRYHSSRVESIKSVTHDTKVFSLRLPAASYLHVPIGHHLSIKADIDGEEVERSYTPVSGLEVNHQRHDHPTLPQESEGEVIELMIKLYKIGKMSGFLSNLKIGDEVMLSDPEGSFDAASKLTPASDILLIAAGSGFTPMVKILREFASTELVTRQRIISTSEASGESSEENQQAPELPPLTNKVRGCSNEVVASGSPKKARLLFANKKAKDIMCERELEQISHATAQRFMATHILSGADKSWCGMKGRVNETLLRANLPAVKQGQRNSALVCLCGPEPFTSDITNMLVDLDFPDDCIHVFL